MAVPIDGFGESGFSDGSQRKVILRRKVQKMRKMMKMMMRRVDISFCCVWWGVGLLLSGGSEGPAAFERRV